MSSPLTFDSDLECRFRVTFDIIGTHILNPHNYLLQFCLFFIVRPPCKLGDLDLDLDLELELDLDLELELDLDLDLDLELG